MKRRSFLKVVGGLAGTSAGGDSQRSRAGVGNGAAPGSTESLPRRVLGRTGQQVSVIGFPGLSLVHADQETCTAAIRQAIQRGVNYLDVASAYGNGEAETKMGVGLQGVDRQSISWPEDDAPRSGRGARGT